MIFPEAALRACPGYEFGTVCGLVDTVNACNHF